MDLTYCVQSDRASVGLMWSLATLQTDAPQKYDFDEWKAAVRNVKRLARIDFRVVCNDEFVSKYVDLRRLKGGDQCRITADLLLNFKSKDTSPKSFTHTSFADSVFEAIARETKLAVVSHRFCSEHVQDASTVEFWLRKYVAHIFNLHKQHIDKLSSESQTSNDAFVDTLPDNVKDYLEFVLDTLLKSHCRSCLAKFTSLFVELGEFCPQLLPPMAHALMALTRDRLCSLMLLISDHSNCHQLVNSPALDYHVLTISDHCITTN